MKPQVIDELVRETYDADPAVRKHAARELCTCALHVDRAAVWERIFELTRDDDLGVRRTGLHTLIDGSPRAREADVVAAVGGMESAARGQLGHGSSRKTRRKKVSFSGAQISPRNFCFTFSAASSGPAPSSTRRQYNAPTSQHFRARIWADRGARTVPFFNLYDDIQITQLGAMLAS